MKKAIVLMLVLCLLLGLSSAALAAGAPKVTKQPVSQTTNSKGTVTFSFSAKNYSTNDSGWRFVNPATGEEYTGPQMRELLAENKGTLSVSNGKQKLTLTKVPESMHGWDVYFVLVNNGYTVYTDRVKLWCYGLAQTEATPSSLGETAASGQPAAEQTAEPTPKPAKETITIKAADGLTLTPLTSKGKKNKDKAGPTITFKGSGSFVISSDKTVEQWIVNGMAIVPAKASKSITLKNVTVNMEVSAKFKEEAEATAPAETAAPAETPAPAETASPAEASAAGFCQITCSGCVFTWHGGSLSSVTSGSVPSGTSVIVVSSGADVSKGYTINGEAGLHAGRASFMLTVTEDTSISLP